MTVEKEKAKKFSEKYSNGKHFRDLEFGYENGFSDCQKEYEEKLRWIPVEEKLPEFDNTKYQNGDFEKYEVKFCTGGMSPKYFIQISYLIRENKFSGEFDWTKATHWRRPL